MVGGDGRMKRQNRYFCDNCGHDIDPRKVIAVTVSHIRPSGIHEVIRESHYCELCAEQVVLRAER